MLGTNLGLLLYGEVSVMAATNTIKIVMQISSDINAISKHIDQYSFVATFTK